MCCFTVEEGQAEASDLAGEAMHKNLQILKLRDFRGQCKDREMGTQREGRAHRHGQQLAEP